MEDVEALIARTKDLVERGKLGEAIALLRDASDRQPENYVLAHHHAWYKAYNQSWFECKQAVESLVSRFPNNPNAWLVKARALESAGKYKKALACLDKAEALGATASSTSPPRARCYEILGDKQKAAEFLEKSKEVKNSAKTKAISHYNQFPPVDQEQLDQASKELSELGLWSTEVVALQAGWLDARGKTSEARDLLVAALTENPSSPTILEPLIGLYYREANPKAITEVLERALISQPENMRLSAYYLRALRKQHKYLTWVSAALRCLRATLKVRP